MPIEKLMNTTRENPAINGALSGVVGGTLASALTTRKSARGLLRTGGLIAIGGIAWKAYDAYRKSSQNGVFETEPDRTTAATGLAGAESAFIPEAESNATLIIDALIAAAHADDHLTEAEKQRVWEDVLQSALPPSVLDEVSLRLNHPPSTAEIAARAGSMAVKIEVYTASLLVLDDSCERGQQYLGDLGDQLGLPASLRQALESSVEQSPVAA